MGEILASQNPMAKCPSTSKGLLRMYKNGKIWPIVCVQFGLLYTEIDQSQMSQKLLCCSTKTTEQKERWVSFEWEKKQDKHIKNIQYLGDLQLLYPHMICQGPNFQSPHQRPTISKWPQVLSMPKINVPHWAYVGLHDTRQGWFSQGWSYSEQGVGPGDFLCLFPALCFICGSVTKHVSFRTVFIWILNVSLSIKATKQRKLVPRSRVKVSSAQKINCCTRTQEKKRHKISKVL